MSEHAKISFYEKVIVLKSDRFPDHVGRTGVVVGISEEDGVVYGYAISFIDDPIECADFALGEVRGTGKFVDRSVLYDDSDRIRVRVKGDQGSIAEE